MRANVVSAKILTIAMLGVLLASCRGALRLEPGPEGQIETRIVRLLAGTGRADILPPWHCSLSGYGKRMGRGSLGVHDRPLVRAVWLCGEQAPQESIAIVSAELLIIPESLRERVLRKLGNDRPRALLLAATHTHSSVGNYDEIPLAQLLASGGFREPLLEFLAQRIAQAVRLAKDDLRPAKFGAANGQAKNLSVHRRDPSLEVDDILSVMRLEGEDGKPIARLVSFAAHPTVLPPSNRLLSGDFPGALCRAAERRWGGNVLFFNAACAEIAPLPPGGGQDFAAVQRLGEAIADKAEDIDANIVCKREIRFGWRGEVFSLPEHDAYRVVTFPLNYLFMSWIEPQIPQEARLQAFSLGPVRLASFPCDFGVVLGRRLRQSGEEMLIPVSYADGFIGYAIDAQSYEKNWYESKMSFYGPNLGEFLLNAAVNLGALTQRSGRVSAAAQTSREDARTRGSRNSPRPLCGPTN